MPERTLTVRIVGDDSSLRRTFQEGSKSAQSYGISVAGLGRNFLAAGVAAGAGVASFDAVTRAIGESIDAASNLAEQQSKNRAVFKDSSQEVIDWSRTTAASIGIAQDAALEATGTFGNLFSTVGLAPDVSAQMSRALVQLAADLASFNNASPEDALEAIRSGLIGEAEPLRRYGVLLSETRVQQQALADTGKTSVKSLTDQEKALARYEIILRDTAPAQGDFARTSQGLANQTRVLKAQLRDVSAAFGGILIPKLLETVGAVNDLAEAWKDLRDAIPGAGKASSGFFGEFFKSLPAQLDDRIHDLGRLREDIELIAAGKGFEKRPSEHPFTDIGKAVKDDIDEAAKQIEASVPVTLKIAGAVDEAVTNLTNALERARKKLLKQQALEARHEAERAAKAWNEFILGMGLKLDRAQLTESTNDDLAALRELEAAIQRRIAAEGRTFALVKQLTDTRLQINAILRDQATAAATASSDAFSDAIDALDLKLDIAKTTRGFNDDMRILKQIERQILDRIRAEGRTTDLLRQLFENRQAQQETLREARNAAAFEALGLTAEGDRPTPSGAALLKRAKGLREQIRGTILDTPKTRRELRRIVDYLKDHLRTAGREVRQAILGMLNDISSALDSGDKPKGPLTKFAKTGIGKLIEGLGLTPEQVRELRARMSAVGPGLSVPARGTGAFGMRVPAGAQVGPARGPREEDFVFHIYIDGQPVEATVTRRQQKKQGRTGRSRRGVRPGR